MCLVLHPAVPQPNEEAREQRAWGIGSPPASSSASSSAFMVAAWFHERLDDGIQDDEGHDVTSKCNYGHQDEGAYEYPGDPVLIRI